MPNLSLMLNAIITNILLFMLAVNNTLANSSGIRFFNARYFSNSIEVVLAAIARDFLLVEHTNKKLKNTKIVMLAVVGKNGGSLKHASTRLRSDPELVLVAANQNTSALEHAAVCLKDDTANKIIAAVRANPQILASVSGGYFADITNHNITPDQRLLRESILAKALFRRCGLYIKARLLLDSFFPQVCQNRILSFMFPKYDPDEVNMLCSAKNPAASQNFADSTAVKAEEARQAPSNRAAALPGTQP